MPTLPATLATRAERWFGRPVAVTTVDELSPNLRRVSFAGESMLGRSWRPGHEIDVRVSERDLRHYSPSRFDAAAGTFDITFCTLAGGPGSSWAARLRPGDRVAVFGPSAGLRVRPGHARVVLGDASTLGTFTSLGQNAIRGAIEVPAADREAAEAMAPHLHILTAAAEPGAALRHWLALLAAEAMPRGDEITYLAGHAHTLQRLRAMLLDRAVPRNRIVAKAFWVTGRAGL
jgi:NADPH-dependent ferric siderophore reductase